MCACVIPWYLAIRSKAGRFLCPPSHSGRLLMAAVILIILGAADDRKPGRSSIFADGNLWQTPAGGGLDENVLSVFQLPNKRGSRRLHQTNDEKGDGTVVLHYHCVCAIQCKGIGDKRQERLEEPASERVREPQKGM